MFPRHLSLPPRERSNLSLPAAQGFGLLFPAAAASVAAAGISVLFSIYGSRRLRRLEDGLLQRCGHPDSDGVKPEIFLCALLDASSVEARAASISSSSVMFVLQRCLGVSFSACRVGGPGSPVLFVPPGLCGSALVSYLWSASATSLAPGAPHPSNQNGIGGCGLLRLLLFSNNPSAWVRHLRAVNGSVRLRVLSILNDGIVGLRLLFVPPMVSIFWLALGLGSDSSLG
ncbi:hypothetical protein HID58_051385 [Brassica napus]|uniref:Uncharacterized protein n=1 Tax=Brassica napus TaxID=3708 RepID=A0ABQ8A8X1_BRANA|nr:hypothetical protein HID58_051385 [Brassica napus]